MENRRDVCWFCGGQLIWNNDMMLEDYGLEGEGIVAFLQCKDCGAETYAILRLDEEE